MIDKWITELFTRFHIFFHMVVLQCFQTSFFLILFLLSAEVIFGEQRNSLTDIQFPNKVEDINGRVVDVAKLVEVKTVTVVTLKATWCPICQEQLIRLKNNLQVIDTEHITFLVLSPGPKSELVKIKKSISFPYPFIEDRNLRIAKSLGLDISDKEITPSIFILNKHREIRWMQKGRSSLYYGDQELLNEIGIVNWI